MRTREVVARIRQACVLCGSADVVAVRSRLVRRGLAWPNTASDPHEHRHELCRGCGAKNNEIDVADLG